MYPQKLASLDLDLAVAPLENNQFNDCKSNLRLLEYGSCGYAVISSNTRAFKDSKLPVQIVKNRYKDWIEAIRSQINDLSNTHRIGKDLKEEVSRKWLLDRTQNINWLSAWGQ
jgi:hypothetical protein